MMEGRTAIKINIKNNIKLNGFLESNLQKTIGSIPKNPITSPKQLTKNIAKRILEVSRPFGISSIIETVMK